MRTMKLLGAPRVSITPNSGLRCIIVTVNMQTTARAAVASSSTLSTTLKAEKLSTASEALLTMLFAV